MWHNFLKNIADISVTNGFYGLERLVLSWMFNIFALPPREAGSHSKCSEVLGSATGADNRPELVSLSIRFDPPQLLPF